MPQTHAPLSTVSNSQRAPPNAEGAAEQRALRGIIRETYEEEGAAIVAALAQDLESTGLSDKEIEQRTGVGAAQLSRIRGGQAHPPGALIAWAIEQSRYRPPRIVVAVCASADGEFKPRPPPSVEERHEATLAVLHDMGIDEVVRAKVARVLGVTP